MFNKPDELTAALMRRAGDNDPSIALAAQYEVAKALSLPLRDAILPGNIVSDIYGVYQLERGANPEWPLDLINPGEEDDYVSYVIPGNGRIPERSIESDYVTIPTYRIANSIDMLLRHVRDAQWNVLERAVQVMQAGFVKKINDDGWRVILGAGVDRNVLIYDADAVSGQFTKRLVSIMKVQTRRSGGGNSASLNRRRLTDLYLSPEALEDIRNWGLDQLDEITRREVYMAADGGITRVFGVNLHDIDELGAGQQYQNFYTNQLSGTLPGGDVEIVVGMDLQNANFVMPVRETLAVFPDQALHRQQRVGYYGWFEGGFGCLDNRDVILGSI
jgi:hypothetical protein